MILKNGAWFLGMNGVMILACVVANDVLKELGIVHGATITEGTGDKHGRGSRHFVGFAIDVRHRELSAERQQLAVQMLRERLGEDFDVVLEPTHIHIEFDPDNGVVRG